MSLKTSQPSRTQQVIVVLIALLALGGVVAAPGAVVAQGDDERSPLPMSVYGDITVNGDPGDGVEVTAEINGEERGSIVADDGTYGGPGTLDEKLTVNGQNGEEGATVEFFVDGEPADTTPESISYKPGEDDRVDITVSLNNGGGDPGDGGDNTVNLGGGNTGTVNPPGSSVDSATITLPAGSGASTVTVTTANSPTGSAPDPGGTVATYIDISADVSVQGDTTIRTDIPQSTLNSANVSDPTIAHFVDGSWEELATTSSTSGNVVTLTATASELSPFAIAQAGSIDTGGNNNNNVGDDDDGGGGGGGGGAADTGTGTGVDAPNISSELGDQATVTAESEPLITSESDTRSTATFLESFPLLRSVSFIKTDGFDEFSGTVNARAIDGEPAATGVPEGTVVSLTNVAMPSRNVSQVQLRYEIPNSRLNDLEASGDELTVRQFDGSNWQEVDVEAEDTGNTTIITAQLSDTTSSYFALMAPAVEGDTAAGEDDGGDEDEEEPSSDDAVPGFGTIVSIVSIIAMMIALSRRE